MNLEIGELYRVTIGDHSVYTCHTFNFASRKFLGPSDIVMVLNTDRYLLTFLNLTKEYKFYASNELYYLKLLKKIS